MKNYQKNKHEAWKLLEEHYRAIGDKHMELLFAEDKHRADKFSIRFNDFFIDYSKHRITEETFALLISLAEAVNIKDKIKALFDGEKINVTEQRAALHTALRRPADDQLIIDDVDITARIHAELGRMACFIESLQAGEIKGSTGKPIHKVINIGIGGSDLGPRLAIDALHDYGTTDVDIAFVANLHTQDIHQALECSDPETTLFIVTSKSFTTLETHANAEIARQWLIAHGCKDTDRHFVAVSANKKAVLEFGVAEDRIFTIWDWVGGRYSIWSAVGLPIAIFLGMDQFKAFLHGAQQMDLHFLRQPPGENIPVILAMLSIWYSNFFHAESLAIVPYDQDLRLLPEYLSQLIMESNGKGVNMEGETLDSPSSPILWGSVGTNAQHAFFQLLHQGTHIIPVEFLLPLQCKYEKDHHKLVANCIAQSKALMFGRENKTEPQRNFPGNRPSTTIMYERLTPMTLGSLLAMYEHRTFVQAMVWGINPFDQFGVELGKTLAQEIISELEGNPKEKTSHDASTSRLIAHYQKNKQ